MPKAKRRWQAVPILVARGRHWGIESYARKKKGLPGGRPFLLGRALLTAARPIITGACTAFAHRLIFSARRAWCFSSASSIRRVTSSL